MGRITLNGFYKWNPALFDLIVFPNGIQKELWIRYCIRKIGQQFPWQQDGDRLPMDFADWFAVKKPGYDRIAEALNAEYNPIENFDRYEDIRREKEDHRTDTETRTGETSTGTSFSEQIGVAGTDSATSNTKDGYTTENSVDMTETNSGTDTGMLNRTTGVSAYDASGYTPREQSDEDNSVTRNSTIHQDRDEHTHSNRTISATESGTRSESVDRTNSGTQSGTEERRTDADTTGSENETVASHLHGNIGVTTNQQMVTAEVELREKYDLYTLILYDFEREFMSQIY